MELSGRISRHCLLIMAENDDGDDRRVGLGIGSR